MRYDFDELINRRGTNSYKWDSAADGVLPMWVADMDFRTAPAITEALRKRVEHGIFGYTKVPGAYYEAVTGWFARRHNWRFDKEWMIYTSGVVPAVSAIIKALTVPGDKVLVHTPVYNCFFSSIRNNGCVAVELPLVYENNTYHIDFDDFERAVSDPAVKIYLLCNPHNPAGRVWTRDELLRMGGICARHGVTVVSDEIHCELTRPGCDYVPFASVADEFQRSAVTCLSPSKAFNIAGLQIANIVAADESVRKKIDKAININEVCDVNPFGVIATIAAYSDGEQWLDELREYIYANYVELKKWFGDNYPQYSVTELEGTYLVWVDFRSTGLSSKQLEQLFIEKGGVWLNEGTMYGAAGEGFMRINIACPRVRLLDGLGRIGKALTSLRRH